MNTLYKNISISFITNIFKIHCIKIHCKKSIEIFINIFILIKLYWKNNSKN